MTRIGSLCSGYGGLDQAAEHVLGGTLAWLCEYDAAPSALLAHHYPDVRNYGDLTALEWADDPVDVLTAGYPCQPFSGAGKRLGTDDPRHLFPWIARGVDRMRPALLLLENVRGHLTLGFDVVLAELDRIGYDVRWTLLRAADVGAPHGRARLWIFARAREVGGWPRPAGEPTAYAEFGTWIAPAGGLFGPVEAAPPGTAGVMVDGQRWDENAHHVATGILLPTPVADHSRGLPQPGTAYASLPNAVAQLLPTPAVNDMGAGKTPEQWDAWTDRLKASHGNGNGHGPSLSIEAARLALLPTPVVTDAVGARNRTANRSNPNSTHSSGTTLGDIVYDGTIGQPLPTPKATDGTKGGPNQRGSSGDLTLPSAVQPHNLLPTPSVADTTGGRKSRSGSRNDELLLNGIAAANAWGPYAPAVARWEHLTRPAPAPTEPGRNGPRLSPAFVEWMMGLPAGWVTAVPGLSRNAQLKMLGNGVVPQQAAVAFALLGVGDLTPEAAA